MEQFPLIGVLEVVGDAREELRDVQGELFGFVVVQVPGELAQEEVLVERAGGVRGGGQGAVQGK